MPRVIDQHLVEIHQLSVRFRVRRLDLIGSALRPDFDPERSDLDFVVEFDGLSTDNAADRYFGLLHALEDLFHRPIDLVSYSAIRNPYFKQIVDRDRVTLYAA